MDNKIRDQRKPKRAIDDGNTINILTAVIRDPHVSTRQFERESGISRRSTLRILHVNQFHPFHISHQQLNENDFHKRLQFCEWGLRKLQDDEMFLNKILFTHEATFTNHGEVNRHNMHYWSVDNPRWLREVNVWCGLLHNKIIGPYFIDGTLNGRKYDRILILPFWQNYQRTFHWIYNNPCGSKTDVPLIHHEMLENFWTRNLEIVGLVDQEEINGQHVALTPLDFYLWGKLKEQVYRKKPTTKHARTYKKSLFGNRYKWNLSGSIISIATFILKVDILNTCISSEYINNTFEECFEIICFLLQLTLNDLEWFSL